MSFGLGFGTPWWLLLLMLLPLTWWMAQRSLAGLSGRRRIVSIVLRSLVLLLLVFSLAEFRILKRNERLAVVFVVDRSESIPAEKREAARQYILEEAEKRSRIHEDLVGVVAFGKMAGIESAPKRDPLELESFVTLVEPDATNIAAALRLAAASFPDQVSRRVVLLTDGNENRESVLEEVRNVRAQGITVDVVPISYSYPAEVSVEKLLVDPEVNVGQPFTVRVVVESTKESESYLRLFENDVLVSEPGNKVTLKPGKNVFNFQRRFELSGKYDFEARLEPLKPEDDNIILNNSANGFTFIQGEPRVLLCTPEPDLEGTLVKALNDVKIAVKTVTPEFLPRSIEEYFEYQAVVFSNVAAHALTEDQMLICEALVKTVGIGFVMIGGEDSFGAGGYQGTPIERLLPVDMEIQQRKVLPNGALAMVIHSCEMGNGNQWAIQVIQQAIRILSPRDYAGVVYYDNLGQDRWLFPMTQVAQRQMMFNRLNGFNPGDMPSFANIVEMAYQGLMGTNASIKHMIILSDGDPSMPTSTTVNAIKAARMTISTICYGSHGGIPPGMQQLAQQCGGKFWMLQSPRNLSEIFIREASTVQKSLISEEVFQPVLAARGAFLMGIDSASLPPLDGYVITTAKELATINLHRPPGAEDPTQDPVLASWSYGLGRSLAFTSDAGRRWGKRWAAWSGYQRFWAQCLRWVSRPKNDDRFRISRSIAGEKGSVSIDAIAPDGQFYNGLRVDGRVTGPDFETSTVQVRQVSPGRYVADFPVNKRGSYTVSLGYEKGGVQQSVVTGVTLPYSAEYRKLETNYELLRNVAEAGGGRYFDDPAEADFYSRDFPETLDVQSIWHGLLLAALSLFFSDVFVRRVVIDYRKALAEGARKFMTLLWRRSPDLVADSRLEALLERKQEVRELTRALYQPGKAAGASSEAAAGAAAKSAKAPESSLADAGAVLKAKDVKQVEAEAPSKPRASEVPGESAYTSRLLAAKRRALGRDGKDESK